jgi:hypothetical protein
MKDVQGYEALYAVTEGRSSIFKKARAVSEAPKEPEQKATPVGVPMEKWSSYPVRGRGAARVSCTFHLLRKKLIRIVKISLGTFQAYRWGAMERFLNPEKRPGILGRPAPQRAGATPRQG